METQGPTVATGPQSVKRVSREALRASTRSLPERGFYGEGKLKMRLTHRYFDQVKEAERLDQKVAVRRLIICGHDE